MLVIRKAQMQVFEHVRLPAFEDTMVSHLKDFSPIHSAVLGEAGMRALIGAGIERAKEHGFTYHGPVRFYIETMVLLGIDFDTDPQYPWAGSILRDESITDQVRRADSVHERLLNFLDSACGHDREYSKPALHRAREVLYQPVTLSKTSAEDELVGQLREIHPEKVAFIGEDIIRSLIPRATEEAQKYSVPSEAGVWLFLLMMFLFGHGVARDPKYPWIAQTLAETESTNPNSRVAKLYSRMTTYLDDVLRQLERQ